MTTIIIENNSGIERHELIDAAADKLMVKGDPAPGLVYLRMTQPEGDEYATVWNIARTLKECVEMDFQWNVILEILSV